MASVELETCANCCRAIGKLETPMLWREEIVCADCHTKLSKAKSYGQTVITENEDPPAPVDIPLSSRELQAEEIRKLGSTNSHSYGNQKLGEDSKPMPKAIKSLIVIGIILWIPGTLIGLGWLGVFLTAIGLIGWVVWVATGRK